jgi:lipopolysaccharide export system protein LptA
MKTRQDRFLPRGMGIVLAFAVLISFGTAHAAAQKTQSQGPPNALQGFSQNRDKPVKIQAASLEVREKDKMATFTGDVQVFQGDTEMRCKSLVVFYEEGAGKDGAGKDGAHKNTLKAADPGPQGQQEISRIEAKGGVVVVQKDQHAQGDTAHFNMKENTVTLVGNVIVTRGQDVLRGQRLVVDLTSGVSKMDQGRVEGLFQARSRNEEKK